MQTKTDLLWRGRHGLALSALLLGLGAGVGLDAQAQLERSDDEPFIAPEADDPIDEPAEPEVEIEIEEIEVVPGFVLPLADDLIRDQIEDFNRHLDDSDWGNAFRVLSEMGDNQLQAMVPVGEDGEYAAVKEQLQRQLLALPADGRRAFRQYFDGQARQMLAAIRNHPMPGSDEQLGMAQALVDRLLATSVGGEAAILLGDMYFERGVFTRAENCWSLALEHGQVSGRDVFELQVRRALALLYSDQQTAAVELYGQLDARYDETTMRIGGSDTDALALLASSIEQAGAGDTVTADVRVAHLPEAEAVPAWNLRYLSEANADRMLENQQQSGYYYYQGPNDLIRYVPDVVADDQQLYFHWLGVVFALNRESGKIVWQQGSIRQTAESVQMRRLNSGGDPRNYNIAISREAVLVTAASIDDEFDRFVLTAYDPVTGEPIWNSTSAEGWGIDSLTGVAEGVSMLGEVLVHGDYAYAVVRPVSGSDCHLRRFNPATGEVDWTMLLGSGDVITYQYTQIRRMPQPRLAIGDVMIYVMTNNGMLLAVDISSADIRWALRTDTPLGVGVSNNGRHHRIDPGQIHSQTNINGADGLILNDGVLYLKEHNTSRLYAVDPNTGDVEWSASTRPGIRIVGVDNENVYAMNQELFAFNREDGDSRSAWSNRQAMSSNEQSAAAIIGDRVVLMSNRRLEMIPTGSTGSNTSFESNYFGNRGGRVYLIGDLFVCMTRTDITAFRASPVPTN